MLDDLIGAAIAGLIGQSVEQGAAQGNAKRKARRFLAGEPVTFRAFLQREGDTRQRRGRLRVSPGTEVASWRPWPARGRPPIEVLLIGGKGFPASVRWPMSPAMPGHGWRVRIGEDQVATVILERNYLASFGPLMSLGTWP